MQTDRAALGTVLAPFITLLLLGNWAIPALLSNVLVGRICNSQQALIASCHKKAKAAHNRAIVAETGPDDLIVLPGPGPGLADGVTCGCGVAGVW